MSTTNKDIAQLTKLLKLGLKEENAIQFLLKNKELELKKLEIINNNEKTKNTRIINYIRKRKLQTLESSDFVGHKCKKPNDDQANCMKTYNPFCDDIVEHVLSFLGRDFEVFRLFLVSKQFHRIITENKQHTLCVHTTIDMLNDFCESPLVGCVNNLRIYQAVDAELFELIVSKFKVVHLLLTLTEQDKYSFGSLPNFGYLESLEIHKSARGKDPHLFSRYFYNLKKLVIRNIGGSEHLPNLINETTNCVSTLKLYGDGHYIYPEESTWLVNPFLTTLKIKHLQMSMDVLRIIFSCKSLKKLYLNTEDVDHNGAYEENEHENDEYDMPNLEYFKMCCKFSELIASRLRAPKLKSLYTTGGMRNKNDCREYWKNFEQFTHLEKLSVSEIEGNDLLSCSNLSKITELSTNSMNISKDLVRMNYFSNLRILDIFSITKNGKILFEMDCDLNLLEKLSITHSDYKRLVDTIASCKSMKSLKELRIRGLTSSKTFTQLLSSNPYFSNLKGISYNFTDDDVDSLISSKYLKKLKRISLTLSVGENTLTACGLRKLTEWNQLEKIEFAEEMD